MKKEYILAGIIGVFLLLNFILIPDYFRAASRIEAQAVQVDTFTYTQRSLEDEYETGFYQMEGVDLLFESKDRRNPLLKAYDYTTNELLWQRKILDKKIIVLPPKYIVELEEQPSSIDTLPSQYLLSGIDLNTGLPLWKTNLGELGLRVQLIKGVQTLLIKYEKKGQYFNEYAHQIVDITTGKQMQEEIVELVPSIYSNYISFESLQKKSLDWTQIDYYKHLDLFFDGKNKQFFKLQPTKILQPAVKVNPNVTHWVFEEQSSIYQKGGNIYVINRDKNKQQWQEIAYDYYDNIHVENKHLILYQEYIYYIYHLDNINELEATEKKDKNSVDEPFNLLVEDERVKCIVEQDNNSIYINTINLNKQKELKMNTWRGERFFRKKDDWLFIYEQEKESDTYSPNRTVYKYKVPFDYESQ